MIIVRLEFLIWNRRLLLILAALILLMFLDYLIVGWLNFFASAFDLAFWLSHFHSRPHIINIILLGSILLYLWAQTFAHSKLVVNDFRHFWFYIFTCFFKKYFSIWVRFLLPATLWRLIRRMLLTVKVVAHWKLLYYILCNF